MQKDLFVQKAEAVGATVQEYNGLDDACQYIINTVEGELLVPQTELSKEFGLAAKLQDDSVTVYEDGFRHIAQIPQAGVTFSSFALADTGTVVLESTAEDVRLATTIVEKHFVIVDPETIVEDNLAAIPHMEELHSHSDACCVAYITGPSRTADIERVLTIGCHGPRELHILLVPGVSNSHYSL